MELLITWLDDTETHLSGVEDVVSVSERAAEIRPYGILVPKTWVKSARTSNETD